jgi:hypothetical protein
LFIGALRVFCICSFGKNTINFPSVEIKKCKYQFDLYDCPLTEAEREEVLRLHQFILYNDSVVFESYGDYYDLRGFPDKDEFQSLRH